MNDIATFLMVVGVIFGIIIGSFSAGKISGKMEICETLSAEYKDGKCYTVNRKEIKL